MNKRMILMLLGVGVVFGGIFGFKAFVNAMITEVFDTMPPPTATITAAEAREVTWTRRLEAVGSFAPVEGAMLTAEVGGIVREIRFQSGSAVEAGAELVVLDSESDRARLASLEAAQRLAQTELRRARRLVEANTVTEAELQRAESEFEQANAAVAEQRARIRQKTVRAPFAGAVGIRRVNVGQYVSPGDPVVSLQTVDPIYLNFSVPERRVGDIHPGQALEVRVDARAAVWQGTVSAVEPAVSAATRTFEVQAQVANPDGALRAGMFGRVSLPLGAPETVVTVPLSAVRFSPYGDAVWIVAEDAEGVLRVTQRFVQTGARRGDLVEVRAGLAPGTRVATSGLLKLRNDAAVLVSDDPAVQPGMNPDARPDNA
ncbi:efflux RND transporter periplasmic adaptor subunit [Ectothiorhodospiraceae bacterium 2226]|nr:efflux RND transporter periplasmic adaptor subunit [Ectothiorhodospiraceae bacterium 2226]